MSKESFRKVITCRHEPACFFRDLPMGNLASGHFGRTCYRPQFMFNQFGDLKRSLPRPGNVHGADGWRDVLEPVVERYGNGTCVATSEGMPPPPDTQFALF